MLLLLRCILMPLHTFPSLLSTPESEGFNHIFRLDSIQQHCCLLLRLTPNNVTKIRAPLHPSGCPSATAPPWGFSRSCYYIHHQRHCKLRLQHQQLYLFHDSQDLIPAVSDWPELQPVGKQANPVIPLYIYTQQIYNTESSVSEITENASFIS